MGRDAILRAADCGLRAAYGAGRLSCVDTRDPSDIEELTDEIAVLFVAAMRKEDAT